MLLDEADTYFGRGKPTPSAEDPRGIVNAGHRRGATYSRCVGEGANMTVKDFPVFAPVALAGIGDLPDTVMDRAIIVRMRRRAPSEQVAPYRRRDSIDELHKLRDRLASWSTAQVDVLSQARPTMPPVWLIVPPTCGSR